MSVVEDPAVTRIASASAEVSLYKLKETLDSASVTKLKNARSVISHDPDRHPIPAQLDTDVAVEVPKDVILNVQADEPGSMVNLVPSTSNELWLIRLASIAGFETGSGGFLGTTPASSPVPFSFVGSDLEVSTYVRSGHAALGERISHTFDRRKSCNTGTAVSWRLKNGILFIDLVLAKRMTDEVTRGTHSKTGTKVFVAAGALRDEQQCLIFDLESVEDISMPSRPRTPYKPLDAYNNPCSVHSSVSLNTEQT